MAKNQIKTISKVEHIIQCPDVYVPSDKNQEMKVVIFSKGEFKTTCLDFIPLLTKQIDELRTNAIDYYRSTNEPIKQILIKIVGDKITIKSYANFTNFDKSNFEHVWFTPMTSSNFESSDRTTGGKNGIGAKAVSIFSREFCAKLKIKNEVLIAKSKYNLFESEFNVEKGDSKGEAILTVSYIPGFCNPQSKLKLGKTNKYDYLPLVDEIEKVIPLIYSESILSIIDTGISISINNDNFGPLNIEEAGKMLYSDPDIVYSSSINDHKWSICVKFEKSDKPNVSVINGIIVHKGGIHIKHLYNAFFKVYEKLPNISESVFKTHLRILFVGILVNPEFDAQSKSQLKSYKGTMKVQKCNQLDEMYAYLQKLDSMLGMKNNDKAINSINEKTIPKYRRAYDSKNRIRLFIAEGDSAVGFVDYGLNAIKSTGGFQQNGSYGIGGKPMNTFKEARDVEDELVIMSSKFSDNQKIQCLQKIIGLKSGCSYEDIDDIKTLNYRQIIIAVDQDSDGIGHICALILGLFAKLHPGLLKHKYVKKLRTPIIRANKGNIIYSFYSEKEFEEASKSNKYTNVEYFKGLAGHSKKATEEIFKNLDSNICDFVLDEHDIDAFEIYIGKDTDKRKEELLIPPIEHNSINCVSCGDHLRFETKCFFLDLIDRAMPSPIDGLKKTERIILTGILMNESAKMKVYQLAGEIANKLHYHHGNASIESTIVRMAQEFPTGKKIPLLLGIGNFGSRKMGGKDAGQPRYISVKQNVPLVSTLFNKDDSWLLQYNFEENEMVEPKNYCPVLPLAVLENIKLPVVGWQVNCHARDLDEVVDYVKQKIKNKNHSIEEDLPISEFRNNCDIIRDDNGIICLIGTFEKISKPNSIKITELPEAKIPNSYIENLNNKNFIKKIENHSTDYKIEIIIQFEKSYDLDAKCKIDKSGLCELIFDINLIFKCNNNLNFFHNGKVHHFNKYVEIVDYWFEYRKKLFIERIERLKKIINAKIKLNKNIILFIENKSKFSKIEDENEYENELEKIGCVRLNVDSINSPKYTEIDKLDDLFYKTNINYNYILNLRERDTTIEAKNKHINKIKKFEDELDSFSKKSNKFQGDLMWIEEIDNFVKAFKEKRYIGEDSKYIYN